VSDNNNQRLSRNKSGIVSAATNSLPVRLRKPKFKINAVDYEDVAKIESSSS